MNIDVKKCNNDLRALQVYLHHGDLKRIAEKLGVSYDTVKHVMRRSYKGGETRITEAIRLLVELRKKEAAEKMQEIINEPLVINNEQE